MGDIEPPPHLTSRPSTQALAYLNDIYLFSNDAQVLSKTTQFLADKQHIIKLNEKKCKLISFDDIRQDDFKMPGTMAGGKEKRAEFLEGRIRKEWQRWASPRIFHVNTHSFYYGSAFNKIYDIYREACASMTL